MRDFFNGVAILVSSGIYITSLKIMIVIGVLWYGFKASNGALMEAFKWIITVVIISYTMLFAKSSVVIEDRANPGLSGNKIDNVPFGLAVIAGVSSGLGEHLTSGFEQMFSLPNDMKYSQSGLVLGAKVLKETAFAEFALGGGIEEQQRFKTNFQEFIEACVLINAQQGVPYTVSQLKTSTNLWSLISDKSGLSPIFTFKYLKSNNTQEFLTCKDGIDSIQGDLNKQITLTEGFIASKLFPNYDDALSKYQTSHKTALDYLTTASTTASNNLTQAIMVNEIQQSVGNYASSLGNNTLTPYEQARMDIQQQNTYRIIGANAGSWLIITKTLFEALLYAMFPFVVLFMISPIGGIAILKNYIMIFAWLIMWGPCYAVINMIANYSDKSQTGEAFTQGLTIANQMGVIGIQEQISTMAGYFTMLVPFLPLFIFQGLGAMSSIAHKLGSVMESTASQVAGESSTGNISVGNTSFNNTSANKHDASTFFKGEGHSTKINDDGLAISTSSSGATTVDASGITSKLNTNFSANKQEMSSMSQSVSEIESLSTNKAISNAISNGFSVNSSDSYSQSKTDSITDSMNYTKSVSNDLSKSTGLSQSQVLEASAGIKTGNLSPVDFNARYGGSTTSTDAFKKMEQFAKSEQFGEAFSYMKSNSMNESISFTDSHGNTKTSTIDEALRTSKDYSKQISQMEQMSNIQSTGKTDDYVQFVLSNYGKDSEGIFTHNNHNYDELRNESFDGFSRSQTIGSGNINNAVHMQEMEARAFLNKQSNGMQEHSRGYSNSQTKHDTSTMIPNAEWNISEGEERFYNKSKTEREAIEQRADDNVFVGVAQAGFGQPKDILKDMKDGLNTIKEFGKKDDE
jgi:conjugal transfer mating pair stabilization protein TraG